MKKILFPATALILALAGCASANKAPNAQETPEPAASAPQQQAQAQQPNAADSTKITVDSAKTVVYTCNQGGKKADVAVQYGIKGNEVVAALINVNQKNILMLRDQKDTAHNTFAAQDVIWSAEKATPATVDKVNAGGLAAVDQAGKLHVIANNCALNKKATAAANKAQAAAQEPAKAAASKARSKTRH